VWCGWQVKLCDPSLTLAMPGLPFIVNIVIIITTIIIAFSALTLLVG